MAYLNDIYIFVKTEKINRSANATSHPVETGVDITDNIKRNADTVSISGEIVGENAATDLKSLIEIYRNGELIKYYGRNIVTNAVITNFDSNHPNTVWGGCEFDMTIKCIRIAKSSYTAKTDAGEQQIDNAVYFNGTKINGKYIYHIIKDGDTFASLIGNAGAPYSNCGIDYNAFIELNSSDGFTSEKTSDGVTHYYPVKGKALIVGLYSSFSSGNTFSNVTDAYNNYKDNKEVREAEAEARKREAYSNYQTQVKDSVEADWLYRAVDTPTSNKDFTYISATVDGKNCTLSGFIQSNVSWVKATSALEIIGYEAKWDSENKKVIAVKDGKETVLNCKPYVNENSVSFVPLRELYEQIGYNVNYDKNTKKTEVTKK